MHTQIALTYTNTKEIMNGQFPNIRPLKYCAYWMLCVVVWPDCLSCMCSSRAPVVEVVHLGVCDLCVCVITKSVCWRLHVSLIALIAILKYKMECIIGLVLMYYMYSKAESQRLITIDWFQYTKCAISVRSLSVCNVWELCSIGSNVVSHRNSM